MTLFKYIKVRDILEYEFKVLIHFSLSLFVFLEMIAVFCFALNIDFHVISIFFSTVFGFLAIGFATYDIYIGTTAYFIHQQSCQIILSCTFLCKFEEPIFVFLLRS